MSSTPTIARVLNFCVFLGVEQKRSSFDNLVVTDGNELQKVFERTKYDPTTATKLSDDEVDLKNSRREDISENTKHKSLKSEDGEENRAKQVSEDKASSGPRNNKKRLTSESEKKFKKLHDIRSNRNYKLGERLNIDPERSKDQDHAVKSSVTKLSEKKSAEPAAHGEEAKFEASIGDKSSSVPDSNSSTSTPPPYVLKVKNTPVRAELDDIYFLCEYFPLILSFDSSQRKCLSSSSFYYYLLNQFVTLHDVLGMLHVKLKCPWVVKVSNIQIHEIWDFKYSTLMSHEEKGAN